ncbi:OmpH family outer membrane protein [Thermotoga sp. Ku-13t]|uniref:OmpH family outer membrane protein n=1 Tax=Thermotoga sp. Ku-13t TaxID=1755813 RepID=UPI0013EC0D6A|nr:OmpH family outer membrane protein [Thermotoga sp. Ku-13t]
MKRFLVLTVALVILATAVSFAAGRFGNVPQVNRFMPALPMQRFAPAWKQPVAPAPRYQARQQFTYEEMFKEMNLTKEQAQQMLDAIKETKTKLEALEEEYKDLYDQSKNMTVYEFRNKLRELNQKRAEILQQLRERIEQTIRIEQLQQLMQTYRLRRVMTCGEPRLSWKFDGFRGPVFLNEEFIDALEEYIE